MNALELLRGAWVGDDQAPACGVRWVVDGAFPLVGAAQSDLGEVSGWNPGDCRGIQVDFATPLKLRDAVHLARRTSALWSVCSGADIHMAMVQVLVADDSWARWEERSSGSQRREQLVPYKGIQARHVAAWINELKVLGPEPFMAILQPHMPLEMQVFAFASALEGLHRRHPGKSEGLVIPRSARKAATRSARDAFEQSLRASEVADKVVDLAMKRFTDSLSRFTEPTSKERLRELLTPVQELLPGLFGPDLAEWVRCLVDARNVQAHRLEDDDDFEYERQRQYVAMATAAQWALRAALLLPVFGDELTRYLQGETGWAARILMRRLDSLGCYPSDYSSEDAFGSQYGREEAG